MTKVALTATLILVLVLVLAGSALATNKYLTQQFLDDRDQYRVVMNKYFSGKLARNKVRDQLKELNNRLEKHLIDLLERAVTFNDSAQSSVGGTYLEAVKIHSSAVLATALAYRATGSLNLSQLKAAYEIKDFVKQNPEW